MVFSGRKFFRDAPGNYNRAWRNFSFYFCRLTAAYINNFCGGSQHHSCAQHSLLANAHTFDNDTAGTNETIVFNNYRSGLNRLEDTTDSYSSTQMHPFANLCTGANGSPSINHGLLINISANVYIRG